MWFKAMYIGKYHEFVAIRINKSCIISSDTNKHIQQGNFKALKKYSHIVLNSPIMQYHSYWKYTRSPWARDTLL